MTVRVRDKVEIALACATVPVALELFSATRTLRWIARLSPRASEEVPPARVARHVDRILARLPGPWHRTCLRRAAVMASLLRRAGHDVEVVFGVRRAANGRVEAHAWLRCDGEEPFLEPHDAIGDFEPLRHPSRAAPLAGG